MRCNRGRVFLRAKSFTPCGVAKPRQSNSRNRPCRDFCPHEKLSRGFEDGGRPKSGCLGLRGKKPPPGLAAGRQNRTPLLPSRVPMKALERIARPIPGAAGPSSHISPLWTNLHAGLAPGRETIEPDVTCPPRPPDHSGRAPGPSR